jgi:hypothetical protein
MVTGTLAQVLDSRVVSHPSQKNLSIPVRNEVTEEANLGLFRIQSIVTPWE